MFTEPDAENVPVGAPVEQEKLLDVFEVAALLGVSPDWVRSHSNGNRQPSIPSIDLGKLIRFRRADIEAFIESRRMRPRPKRFRIV